MVLALFQRRVPLSGWVVTWRTLSHKILSDRKWDLQGGRVVFGNLAYTQSLVVSLGNPTIKSCDRHGRYWRPRRSMRGKKKLENTARENSEQDRRMKELLKSKKPRFLAFCFSLKSLFEHPKEDERSVGICTAKTDFVLMSRKFLHLAHKIWPNSFKFLQSFFIFIFFSSLFISASSHFSGSSPCLWSGKCRTCGRLRDLDEFLAKSFLLHFGLSLSTPFGSHSIRAIPSVWSASLCQGEIQYCI